MYCKRCGAQIPDNAKFCPKCGNAVTNLVPDSKPIPEEKRETEDFTCPEQAEQAEQEIGKESENKQESGHITEKSSETSVQNTQRQTGKISRKKILIPVIAVAAAVVVILIAFGVNSSRRINLNNYLEVEFDGYDGHGTVDASINWKAVSDKYDNKVAAGWLYGSFSELLRDCISPSFDPKSNLSNGEQVTVEWYVDTELINELTDKNMIISADSRTFRVSGLEEVEEFDAFEGVSLKFSGLSPDVSASIENNISRDVELYYSLSKSDHLTIGDTVTVSIDEKSADAYAQEYGMYPEALKKDFVVENVDYYADSLDQISDENIEELKIHAEDIIRSVASEWNDDRQLNSMDFLGCDFFHVDDNVSSEHTSKIYLVYKLNATQFGKDGNGNRTETNFDYYYCIGFFNIIVQTDGTISVDYNDYDDPGMSKNPYLGELIADFSVTTYDNSGGNDEKLTYKYAGAEELDVLLDELENSYYHTYFYYNESTVEEQ